VACAPHFIEEQQTIDAAIGAFAFAFSQGARMDERERPMLELEFVVLGELTRAAKIGGLSLFFELDFFAECVAQPALDQIDREISDIDADPLPPEFLRRVNGGATSAKRIKHHIARIAACADDAFQKCLRFLGRITETLLCLSS